MNYPSDDELWRKAGEFADRVVEQQKREDDRIVALMGMFASAMMGTTGAWFLGQAGHLWWGVFVAVLTGIATIGLAVLAGSL